MGLPIVFAAKYVQPVHVISAYYFFLNLLMLIIQGSAKNQAKIIFFLMYILDQNTSSIIIFRILEQFLGPRLDLLLVYFIKQSFAPVTMLPDACTCRCTYYPTSSVYKFSWNLFFKLKAKVWMYCSSELEQRSDCCRTKLL